MVYILLVQVRVFFIKVNVDFEDRIFGFGGFIVDIEGFIFGCVEIKQGFLFFIVIRSFLVYWLVFLVSVFMRGFSIKIFLFREGQDGLVQGNCEISDFESRFIVIK